MAAAEKAKEKAAAAEENAKRCRICKGTNKEQPLRARAAALLLQGVRRRWHLRARAAALLVEGVRRRWHLRARAAAQQLQGPVAVTGGRQRLRSRLRLYWRARWQWQWRSLAGAQRLPDPCELLLVLNHAVLNTKKGEPARAPVWGFVIIKSESKGYQDRS
jgi:hypothetical protein